MKNLVVVESPAKAKTIKKYLGSGFDVLASYGHVRDLIPKEGAVDPEHDFQMRYEAIEKNLRHVDTIAKALKKSDALYLATDPDREGEAISWHIYQLMQEKKALGKKPIHRIVFHEITKSAVQNATQNPRQIDMSLVNAQQTRRALDYLVGFNLSPLLWKKIRPGLSAGRVQSPALRLIVERENEISSFKPQEYWTIIAKTEADDQPFTARLVEFTHKKIEQFSITNEKQAQKTETKLWESAENKLIVTKVDKKQRKRNPAPPFITSTLQQEAARKLGFSAHRTMRIAQQLYEGVDAGEGAVGLITYMRTDSVNLSGEAISEIRAYIENRYGKAKLPKTPRAYVTTSKNAQEAHEAIRPTSVHYKPSEIKNKLSEEQYKLYRLIWRRSIACQMIHATIDTVAIDLSAGEGNRFRANGSTITDPGFIAVYQEDVDDAKPGDSEEKLLPILHEGDVLPLISIEPNQHFTEPPPRYSEASLIKTLEEFGIGRPSTYASIISTLKNREYVILEKKRFIPTDVGQIVNKFLTRYFPKYVDYDFTAKLEDDLDAISRGEEAWIPMLRDFWQPFIELVKHIETSVKRSDVTQEAIEEKCPECGKQLAIRLGKRGRFIGCTGYPTCKYTRNVEGEESPPEPEIIPDRKCPECEENLQIRMGRYGKFIGCTNYPTCKHIESLVKPKDTGVQCPVCKQANLAAKKSRYGKLFYSCMRYPDCQYAVWNEPVVEKCPKCSWPILTIKTTKRRGTEKVCPQKDCGYSMQINTPEEK